MARDFVFVHGGGQAGWVWDETIAAMRTQGANRLGATLALDAPGCGTKRDRDTPELVMADVVDEFLQEIDAAGIGPAVLVGHSQGGQPLVMMVRQRPDLFERVVYVSCSAPLPGQSVSAMMGTGTRNSRNDAVGWPVFREGMSAEERFAVLFCNDMTGAQKSDFLAKVGKDAWPGKTYSEHAWDYTGLERVPATYVRCLRDEALPPRWQEIFADRLGAEKTVQIDAGHQAMNSRPHALAEILLAELDCEEIQ